MGVPQNRWSISWKIPLTMDNLGLPLWLRKPPYEHYMHLEWLRQDVSILGSQHDMLQVALLPGEQLGRIPVSQGYSNLQKSHRNAINPHIDEWFLSLSLSLWFLWLDMTGMIRPGKIQQLSTMRCHPASWTACRSTFRYAPLKRPGLDSAVVWKWVFQLQNWTKQQPLAFGCWRQLWLIVMVPWCWPSHVGRWAEHSHWQSRGCWCCWCEISQTISGSKTAAVGCQQGHRILHLSPRLHGWNRVCCTWLSWLSSGDPKSGARSIWSIMHCPQYLIEPMLSKQMISWLWINKNHLKPAESIHPSGLHQGAKLYANTIWAVAETWISFFILT